MVSEDIDTWYFNTSYVTVQPYRLAMSNQNMQNFNTSYVTVQLYMSMPEICME